jgi:hypothetical protein
MSEIRQHIENPKIVSQQILVSPQSFPTLSKFQIFHQWQNQRVYLIGAQIIGVVTAAGTDDSFVCWIEENGQRLAPVDNLIDYTSATTRPPAWLGIAWNFTNQRNVPLRVPILTPTRAGSIIELGCTKIGTSSITLLCTLIAAVGKTTEV